MLHESVETHNNESVGNPKYTNNDISDFAAAVAELHAILCEAVTCPPGCSGVVWARYHASVAQYGFPAAVEALNRFAVTQKPGAA